MLSQCVPPDISLIREEQVELHPSLGMVITLDSGTQVAYPVYPPIYVQQCDYFVEKDKFNLTFKVCYGTILYMLGEPTLFKPMGKYDWISMDSFPCQKGG